MKKASIVSIGNELLSGQTVNTNAAYLGQKLFSLGIEVVSGYSVGDDTDTIIKTLELACNSADLILVTGGLGPTADDITRQSLAEFLNVELRFQKDIHQKIQDFFTACKQNMSEICKSQAYIPEGATAIDNNFGTAPGIMAWKGEKMIFVMPGVPSEMKQMFEESVLPKLESLAGEAGQGAVVIRKLRCFGAGESTIAELIGSLMQRGRNPLINCTVHYGVITLHIIATADNRKKAEEMVQKDEKDLLAKLGDLVYGRDEQTLAEVVGGKLAEQRKTIALAESCTGGLIAKLFTDIPGSSRYFKQGWITYSNEAKIQELNINSDLIEEYGAVSEQAAKAMAVNARKKSGTDFSVGVTGIAGPGGGSEAKPVGLVYISVDSADGCECRRFFFSHDRGFIRLRAAQTAINMLRTKL